MTAGIRPQIFAAFEAGVAGDPGGAGLVVPPVPGTTMGRVSGPPHPPVPHPPPGPPAELSSFVGRLREIRELEELLGGLRLLTLTGAGGSGKTRLAAELASREARRREVVWVELAPLDDPSLLPAHVAAAAGVAVEPRDVDGLAPLLGGRPLLLVLDNCEHLVDACADAVSALLRACPELSVLATSREALAVRGERAWLVPALELPAEGASAEELAGSESVRLFLERAREAGGEVAPGSTAAVAAVCRALDGIPLAIELAAARTRVLAPEQILERLGDALDLLAGTGRGVVPRHRTLRAAIGWSHDLLRPDARRLLARLSVFRGGASLEAVEAVAPPADEPALDLLTVLVARCLVSVREEEGRARYRLLETVRQYAAERLAASGEEEEARDAHAAFFRALAGGAEPGLTGTERPASMASLSREIENLREALGWSRTSLPAQHVRLVGHLWWFWYSTRHWCEARRWLDGALALPEARGAARAPLAFARGALSALQARGEEARSWLEEAVALAREAGDGRLAAYALNYLGMSYAGEGRPEGRELCREAEAWFREHGDLYGLRLALLLQGSGARALGELEEAVRLNEEGVEVARRFGLDRELSVSLQNLAGVYLVAGEPERARALLLEALEASRRDPSHFFAAIGLAYLAEAEGRLGRPLRAGRLLGAAEGLSALVGAAFFPTDRVRLEAAVEEWEASVGAEAFRAARSAGGSLSLEEALEEALAPGPAGEAAGGVPEARVGGTGEVPAPAPVEAGPDALRIRLLGGFDVRGPHGEVPEARWSWAKPRELLALLARRPDGATRDRLQAELWPGAPEEDLRNRFHVTLHHLRKSLGDMARVRLDEDRYVLEADGGVEVDAARFEAEARQALAGARRAESSDPEPALLEALERYRGDLLDGDEPGPELEAWRDRLRVVELDLHLALARLREARGDTAGALDAYGAAAAREPLGEEAHRGLMRLWAEAGERARALAHYGRVRALLRARLDVAPDPDTEALARSLEAGVG